MKNSDGKGSFKTTRLPAILAFGVVAVAAGVLKLPHTGHAAGGEQNGCAWGSADAPAPTGAVQSTASDAAEPTAGIARVPMMMELNIECRTVINDCAERCHKVPQAQQRACELGCPQFLTSERHLDCPRPNADPAFKDCPHVERWCSQRCRTLPALWQKGCFETCPGDTGEEHGLKCEPLEAPPIHLRPASSCGEVKTYCVEECKTITDPDEKAGCTTNCPQLYASHSGLTC